MTKEKLIKVEIYSKDILSKSSDVQHSFKHLDRVRKNALKIVSLLKINDIELNLLQAMCLLHDIPQSMFNYGPAMKHFFEPYAVSKYLPKILNYLDITKEDQHILMNAITHHPFTVPYKRLNRKGNVYLKILQDSDTIDFLNADREKSFMKIKNNFIFYKILSLVSIKYLSYVRGNVGEYLNFPELARYNWFRI